MERHGQLIGISPSNLAAYKRYHAHVWPDILAKITECNIRNYSIYHHNGLLFAYFDYAGTDYAADMAKMAADPRTQEWWSIMKPLQSPLESRGRDEWWAEMEEVFHVD
jgi:L-rhamnose mutarotase